ncbi:MAG: A/G-specific adenine glycosylase [Ferrovum sp. 37-45-19]|nr:MAG: A/G-specific adenine glycosylase [Ferrovum sp. 21-44-67]OYV94604.1 MAG: A/G-specific adenine glycosylase [Ferrovum sp. 37-45-19]HQU06413.1 A/G-specific adenine glycosylase [Ferrovaceae bacterium]
MTFSQIIISWQKQWGRHHLPWQQVNDPYQVWLSEVMLQQTQVATVIPYFKKFLSRFSTITQLAEADLNQVLELWSGLGYYSRARNLHQAAQQIIKIHHGQFPESQEDRMALPGIGRSTAGAIGVFSFNQKLPILDGNVKRVLTRCFAIAGNIYSRETEQTLWQIAQSLLPEKEIIPYTQGLMDLGATVCTRSNPLCNQCPLLHICQAKHDNQIERFPEKKKKLPPQKLPLHVLILEYQNKFFLVKREDSIWRDLWFFPIIESFIDIKKWLSTNQINGDFKTTYPIIRHQLTHRSIELYVEHWQLHNNILPSFLDDGLWLTLDEVMQKAIPVAIKKVIAQIN